MKPKAARILTGSRAMVFLFFVISSVQCSKYHGETEAYVVNAAASGAQVVPISNSTATAALVGNYSSNKNILSGTISWSGLSGPPTLIHLHGPAKIGISRNDSLNTILKPTQSSTGSMTVSFAFIEAYEDLMLNQMVYFDIHTAAYPKGEVRGQIILQ